MAATLMPLFLWSALWVCGLLLLVWALRFWKLRSDWISVIWILGLGGLAVLSAGVGDGNPLRRWLVAILGGGWSLRLGCHWVIRCLTERNEDGRFRALRNRRECGGPSFVCGFFLLQAFLGLLLAWPFLLAAADPGPVHALVWIGATLWGIALIGEVVADRQLDGFTVNPLNRGKVFRSGLWAFSRHPNYFFEWLNWVAFAFLATASPWGWTAWSAPVLMLYFLLKVTGIPVTEAQALRTMGEAYRRYQLQVRAFFPWLPRESV